MESANHEFTYLSGRAQLSVAHEAKCHDESSVVKIEKPRPTPHPRHQNTIKEPVDNIQSTSSSPSVAPARPIPLPRIIKVFTTPSPVYDEPSKLQSSVFYIATPKNTNPSTIDRSIISEFDPILQRADACSRNSTFYIEPPKSKPVVPDCRNRISSEQVSHFDNPDGVSTTLPKSEGVICQNLLSMNSTVKSTCADFKTNDVLPEPQNDDSSPDFLGSASFLCGSSLSSFSSNSISNSISTSNYNTALSDSEGDPFLSNTASHFNKNEELSVASNSSSENSNALDADKDVESFDRSTGSLSDSPPPPNGPPPFFDYHIEEELPPPLPPRPTPGISPHMTGTEISSSQSQTILQATCATSAIKQPLKCTLSSVPPSPLSSNLITDAVETHVQQCPSQSMLVENPVYLFFESESTSLSFSRINDISKEVKKGCDSDSCESNSCDFESGEPPQFPPPPLPMQSSDSCNSSSPDPSRPSPENSLSTLHPNSLVFSPAKLSYLNNEELQSTKPW